MPILAARRDSRSELTGTHTERAHEFQHLDSRYLSSGTSLSHGTFRVTIE
ncbi:uncharacterized protein PHALS_08409 [Plasmopara halstedii]|uniref:Uncharacterized protein n=1 Tax=Plasmopara halstedii TaxID=4781 RepID=A0A0P1ADF0_PLAHL|nr:uncharacterized protein PHALS_08409 [Plasmopara halstedii]CEG38328.1 hypothetical protein PHALS_08409 [Plasmopara halstedii]|eukprot:XP_024574697.1 hypothetical protein PHALS_08409 [Plasmopara halstedii]